ncbi:transcriptional corepressor LEUNIG [Trifolium repens]|nr:transcriptional corepressor LEUNIG [Trifolium repens]
MEPKHPNQDLFRIVLYDYLKNNGFSDTAEIFRKEAQITGQTPPGIRDVDSGNKSFYPMIQKVYSIVTFLLLITIVVVSTILFVPPVANFFNNYVPDYVYGIVGIFVPLNYSFLLILPVSLALSIGLICTLCSEFNHESYAFVNNFWNLFHDKYISRKQMPGPSNQSQVIVQPSHTSLDSQDPNVGAVMNTTPQILQEKYSLQHLSSFQSGQTLLSCDFSSDGNIVASGGLGNKPFICYMETGLYCGYSATTLESHLSTILEVRFQPGSNKFATCSTDKTVKLWDANTPEKPLFGFVGHNKVISLDFDPSGGILCSSDTSELKVWDVNRQAMIRSLKAGGGLVRFQPGSGKFLAVAKQNVITIIEWSALRVFNKLQGHVKDINSICWDVTGNMIASTSEDDIRVWSVFDGGQCIHEYPSDGKRFQSVIFHPRYHSVLVIGGYQCLELWILENGRQRHSLRASEVSITGLAATMAQSGSIASASNDSVVKIWK